MKKILSFLTLMINMVAFSQENYLFIGTYTSKGSEGVYVYKFDSKTGDFKAISVAKGIKNPSFLAIAPNQKNIYSVGEMDKQGAVNAFSFDKETGELKLLNTESAGGAGPCHIAVDKTGKWAIVGNYVGGSLSILPIQTDGTLGKATQTIQHEGKSVNAERQEKPHVHSINIAQNNSDIFVPDLGIDKLMAYQLDTKEGKLTAKTPTKTTAGAGPRHFTYHPNNKFAYVINELDATITAYEFKNGTLKAIQTVNTLPNDYTGRKWCADVHTSPDGKFLYGSNRAHESLVIFEINQKTGQLTYVGHQDVKGKTPRNFMIDPSGNWALVANQDSDNITIFKRDKKTGKLVFTGREIKVSMPVCLKMMPVE
jgi:6-phosphogluconolactonase